LGSEFSLKGLRALLRGPLSKLIRGGFKAGKEEKLLCSVGKGLFKGEREGT